MVPFFVQKLVTICFSPSGLIQILHKLSIFSIQYPGALDLFFQIEVDSGVFDREAIGGRALLLVLLFLHELANAYFFGLDQAEEILADVFFNISFGKARVFTFINRIENFVISALNNLGHVRVYLFDLTLLVWFDLRHYLKNELGTFAILRLNSNLPHKLFYEAFADCQP